MLYLFWLSLLLILLAILIVKFIDFISPIICDAATSVIKKTIQKYSPKPQPPKIIYNVVEKKEQPVQQYHIQLIAPAPSSESKPEKHEENVEKTEEYEEVEEYTEDSSTTSSSSSSSSSSTSSSSKYSEKTKQVSHGASHTKQVAEDCADLLTKLIVDALDITEPAKHDIDEEKINSLIADALNKFKEEQKPTDVTQMNIQQHAKSNTEAEKVVKLQHDGCENRVDAEVLRCDPTKQ